MLSVSLWFFFLYGWLVISIYLSSLPVAHLSDAPRRRLAVTGDSARIQDETTENSAWFFNVLGVYHRHTGPRFNVSSERQLIILVGQPWTRTHICSDPKHYALPVIVWCSKEGIHIYALPERVNNARRGRLVCFIQTHLFPATSQTAKPRLVSAEYLNCVDISVTGNRTVLYLTR